MAFTTTAQLSAPLRIKEIQQRYDLKDSKTVVWKLLNNVDPKRDLLLSEGPLDALDHSAPYPNFGGKMGIDATNKIGKETSRDWGTKIRMSDEVIDRVDQMWDKLGLPGSGGNIWRKNKED